MPKEQVRKRGKRKPKTAEEPPAAPAVEAEQPSHTEAPPPEDEPSAGPSGIHPARLALLSGKRPPPVQHTPHQPVAQQEEQPLEWARGPRADVDFPFGELDPDLKAYFRNVDDQIKDWEGVTSVGEEREDRQLFLNSVLSELRGHELTVSTDPDTAVVLERLLPSLGDWGRRVIGDAFGDSWEVLFRHRFGSHVVQTWLTLAADTLDREAKGVSPPQQQAQSDTTTVGTLPTMTDLFSKFIGLLQPSIPTLLTHPHASPPLRLLFIVLTPNKAVPALQGDDDAGVIRSKKSGKYRKGQSVQGKSIFGDEEEGKGKGKQISRDLPDAIVAARKGVMSGLKESVSVMEWRGMGVNSVGSAAVQLLLELESEAGEGEQGGSLLDVLTEGLVSQLNASEEITAKEYPALILNTPIGTRLMEVIIRIAPSRVFDSIWQLYFEGKIGKFAGHPYGNFVVARGISRLDETRIENVVKECKAVAGGRSLIKTARTSALVALVNRASELEACQASVNGLIQSALDLPDGEKKMLVPCLMALKTFPTYQAIKSGKPVTEGDADEDVPSEVLDAEAEQAAASAARLEGWKNRRNPRAKQDDLAPNMQGCLLLQAIVRMPKGNEAVLESLLSLDVQQLLEYASSPIASHLLDAVLGSPAVVPKYRRKLVQAFLGHYLELAQDRLGSRVAETIWAKADGFMKEKIAKSLIYDANTLAGSQFGRFLANKIDLHLLERRPDEWRAKHLGVTGGKARPAPGAASKPQPAEKKEKKHERDEIDDMFEGVQKKHRGGTGLSQS